VNLANVSYMDSTGLGLFVGTLKALNQNDKELYILGLYHFDLEPLMFLQISLNPLNPYNLHLLSSREYHDLTGLGLFVGTLKALNQNDKELYILGVTDRISRLFESLNPLNPYNLHLLSSREYHDFLLGA
jgi:anti-anti-sigma regulatory factor